MDQSVVIAIDHSPQSENAVKCELMSVVMRFMNVVWGGSCVLNCSVSTAYRAAGAGVGINHASATHRPYSINHAQALYS